MRNKPWALPRAPHWGGAANTSAAWASLVQGAKGAPGDGGGGHSGGGPRKGPKDAGGGAPFELELDGEKPAVAPRALAVSYVGVPLCIALSVRQARAPKGPSVLRVRVTQPGVYLMISHRSGLRGPKRRRTCLLYTSPSPRDRG